MSRSSIPALLCIALALAACAMPPPVALPPVTPPPSLTAADVKQAYERGLANGERIQARRDRKAQAAQPVCPAVTPAPPPVTPLPAAGPALPYNPQGPAVPLSQ